MGKFHSDGISLTETPFVNSVIRCGPASGRVELERCFEQLFVTCRGSCGQTSEVGSTSSTGRTETSERRGYDGVQATHDAYKLPVSWTVPTCHLLQALWHGG